MNWQKHTRGREYIKKGKEERRKKKRKKEEEQKKEKVKRIRRLW